jgi:hypothetical protein
MVWLIVAAVIMIASLVTTHFVPDRFRWRKIALLVIGILGAVWSFAQGYRNLERVAVFQAKLVSVEEQLMARNSQAI